VNAPAPTRCPDCWTLAAEIVCHVCKLDKRPGRPSPQPDISTCSDEQALAGFQFRHDVRCKIGAGRYP
jgi:hypothetical protein